jgi:hypothetical protein
MRAASCHCWSVRPSPRGLVGARRDADCMGKRRRRGRPKSAPCGEIGCHPRVELRLPCGGSHWFPGDLSGLWLLVAWADDVAVQWVDRAVARGVRLLSELRGSLHRLRQDPRGPCPCPLISRGVGTRRDWQRFGKESRARGPWSGLLWVADAMVGCAHNSRRHQSKHARPVTLTKAGEGHAVNRPFAAGRSIPDSRTEIVRDLRSTTYRRL